jgi:alanyl-tRNA synthetase
VKALFDERRKALANEVAQLRREVAMGGKGVGRKPRKSTG